MADVEARMTNQGRMKDDERRNWGFLIAFSSLIRHSGFVIRHSRQRRAFGTGGLCPATLARNCALTTPPRAV